MYQTAIRSWAFRYGCSIGLRPAKSAELAEDVSQEVLTSIQRKIHSFDVARWREGSFRAWLKTTTCNLLVSYARRERKRRGSGDTAVLQRLLEEPARADLDSEIDKELERQILSDAMQQLRDASPTECALVDELGWGDGRSKHPVGLSPKVVAQKHHTTVSALLKTKSRLKQSLQEIVSRLKKDVD